jgi:hypothetical protein
MTIHRRTGLILAGIAVTLLAAFDQSVASRMRILRRTSRCGVRAERRSAILTYHWVRRIRNMTKFVIAVLAAVALVQPALSVAGDKPTDSGAKPSSFVPHPHTNHHVYGAPIEPAIVDHRKTPHHKHAPKKRS